MMLRGLILSAVLSLFALQARAALVCETNIVSLDFGTISVRDGLPQQTSGPVTISCFGGTPGATIQACLTLGSGSGGAAAGQSPRYLTRVGSATLQYQLSSQNSFSNGGTTWETVGYAMALDATGSAMIAPTLYAEVTEVGSNAIVGAYSSHFDAGVDTEISYGALGCDQSEPASAFTVSATLTTSCTISVSNMDFGVIDTAIVAPVDQTTTIEVSCTNASPYTISIGSGLQPADAGATGRRMVNGPNLLAYGLYHDPSRTSAWGVSPATVDEGFGTGAYQLLTVYGRIFGNQTMSIGSYSDSVVVTVTY